MEKILSRHEKDDLILSMSMLKILEYIDDELLDIVTSVLILETGEKRPQEDYIGIYLHAGFFSCLINGDGIYYRKLIANNLAYVKNGEYEFIGFGDDLRLQRHRSYTCPTKEFFEIREIYNS